MLCVFCQKKGISPPHNHTIRDFSKKNSPIICPQLLNTTCTYCKKVGHTKQYCQLLEKKNDMVVSQSNNKRSNDNYTKEDFKSQKIGIMTSKIAAMEMNIE